MVKQHLKLLKMDMINKNNIVLILIVILAFALRVIAVDKFPAGFNADEAAIGYNAYSIIKTGKDEYGQILPLSFKSFGDYKPGLYFYFVIPFVAVLGLTEFSVRIPSVLLGTGMVWLIYLLARQIFKDRRVGMIAALFLAINPWAIYFSRGGWETNAATFFITLGVYLFIKGLSKNRYLFFSLLSFLISIYLYQSPRLVVPVLVLAFMGIYSKEVFKIIKTNWKKVLMSFIILFVLSLPVVFEFLTGGGSERFQGLSFLSDNGPSMRVNELRGEHSNPDGKLEKIIHNKYLAYGINFLGHYLDHYSSDFLFVNGDPLIRNKTPETGQFYVIQSLFLITGLLMLIKFESKLKYLLVAWVLIAPLASSLTYQTPNAVRSLNMVIPLTLIMGYGFAGLFGILRKRPLQLFAGVILTLFLGFEFVHFQESYYIHSTKRYSLAWEYGFSEMVQKLSKYEGQFNHIIITDRYDQPYILLLFYKASLPDEFDKKYNPAKYQPQAVLSERDKFNFGTVRSFDKYEFHGVTQDEIKKNPNALYVVTPEEAGKDVNIIDAVYFPDGEKAFVFVKS